MGSRLVIIGKADITIEAVNPSKNMTADEIAAECETTSAGGTK